MTLHNPVKINMSSSDMIDLGNEELSAVVCNQFINHGALGIRLNAGTLCPGMTIHLEKIFQTSSGMGREDQPEDYHDEQMVMAMHIKTGDNEYRAVREVSVVQKKGRSGQKYIRVIFEEETEPVFFSDRRIGMPVTRFAPNGANVSPQKVPFQEAVEEPLDSQVRQQPSDAE